MNCCNEYGDCVRSHYCPVMPNPKAEADPGQKPLTVDQVRESDKIMACNAMAGAGISMDLIMEIVRAVEGIHRIG